MNKEQRSIVVEYANSIPDDVLRTLTLRLFEKMADDTPEALNEMSKDRRMDSLLASAESASDLFAMLDNVRDILQKECRKKGLLLKLPTAVS